MINYSYSLHNYSYLKNPIVSDSNMKFYMYFNFNTRGKLSSCFWINQKRK